MMHLLIILLAKTCLALYSTSSNVVDMTLETFKEVNDEFWLIQFYSPSSEDCKNFVEEYEKVAKALKGVMKVGAVDVTEHEQIINTFDQKSLPVIKIFNVDDLSPELFSGKLVIKDIINFVFRKMYNKAAAQLNHQIELEDFLEEVVKLNDLIFDAFVYNSEDPWLIVFYTPWCAHCKHLKPEWSAAARELKGKVKLGIVDGTTNTLTTKEYGVKGYPTMKYLPPGKKTKAVDVSYTGNRTREGIVHWTLEKYKEKIPTPPLMEIFDENSLKKTCKDNMLLVISFLPHLMKCQSVCRNDYLNIIKRAAEEYNNRNYFCWFWSEEGAQPHLEETFEIRASNYPTTAVLNMKRLKYSILGGQFTYEDLTAFLKKLIRGKVETISVKDAKPPMVHTIDKWNGRDVELLEINVKQLEKESKILGERASNEL